MHAYSNVLKVITFELFKKKERRKRKIAAYNMMYNVFVIAYNCVIT